MAQKRSLTTGGVSDRYNRTARFRRMFDELMRQGNVIQGKRLRDVEPLPSSFKCLVDSSSGFALCFRRHVVTPHKEESGVHENELPHRKFRRGRTGSVSRNGTA